MKAVAPERLRQAVATICPDIKARVASQSPPTNERRLWWELCCCLLSSRVPFAVAVAAADAVDAGGLLLGKAEVATLEAALSVVLRQSLLVDGRPRRYPFPTARAKHLAGTRIAVSRAAGTLELLLAGFSKPPEARAWFVDNAPGIGPKQASMFLRNVGISYDLAVLDRHVLNYMAALGIYRGANQFISGLTEYRRHEAVLRSHAEDIGFAVGLLDWAIWIVMRAARCREVELTTS